MPVIVKNEHNKAQIEALMADLTNIRAHAKQFSVGESLTSTFDLPHQIHTVSDFVTIREDDKKIQSQKLPFFESQYDFKQYIKNILAQEKERAERMWDKDKAGDLLSRYYSSLNSLSELFDCLADKGLDHDYCFEQELISFSWRKRSRSFELLYLTQDQPEKINIKNGIIIHSTNDFVSILKSEKNNKRIEEQLGRGFQSTGIYKYNYELCFKPNCPF